MTYAQLKSALDAYFGDTSRPAEETRQGLEDLREEIESLLEAL